MLGTTFSPSYRHLLFFFVLFFFFSLHSKSPRLWLFILHIHLHCMLIAYYSEIFMTRAGFGLAQLSRLFSTIRLCLVKHIECFPSGSRQGPRFRQV
ncbi:hypothetical protein J3F84DRAFT_382254 [Trichoderma pleuroticola]